MNKLTTAALAGLVAVTATANASMSRWNGFGEAAASYIADVQDIWTLPGVVASNKNATYFEFGTGAAQTAGAATDWATGQGMPTNTWGGVHGEVGPGVLGIWVNRGQNSNIKDVYDSLDTAFGTVGNVTVGLTGLSPANLSAKQVNTTAPAAGRVDVLFGLPIGEKLDLGILLSRANRNRKVENDLNVAGRVDAYDANAFGFGVGAEIKELGFIKLLEVGLTVDLDSMVLSYKNTAGEDKIEHSASAYTLRVGGDIAGDDGKFGRAELGYTMGSGASKNGVTSVTPGVGQKEYKHGRSKWNLGYAMGKSGDKGMGLMGLMLKGSGSSTENDAPNTKTDKGDFKLELSTAGEAKVKEWLTARAGIAANLLESSNNTGAGAANNKKTSTSNNGAATLSTGLSLNFGQVTIDGVLNQDVLYTGTYLISGVPETLFSQVSATWAW